MKKAWPYAALLAVGAAVAGVVVYKKFCEKDEECMIEVVVNKEAFFCWAMQYSIHIEVMEPVDMRERISKAVRELNEKYNG